ncbi:hypothetical protein JCM10212_002718 [Sporobolomyces blumeae]
MNGASVTLPSTTGARKAYAAASRAFLVRDYASTASSLHLANSALPRPDARAWIDALARNEPSLPEAELARKLDILNATFLATVHSAGAGPSPAPHLVPLLDLAPDKLVESIWSSWIEQATSNGDGNLPVSTPTGPESVEIVPSTMAARLHPSVVTALALAALKLEQPQLARAVAEAWIGSTTEEIERIAWEYVASIGDEWDVELPLDAARNGSTGSKVKATEMDASVQLDASTTIDKAGQAKRQFVQSWTKLVDLVTLHLLPKLGEWEAAGDFARMQGVENGGWVPDARVEAVLERLSQLRQDEANAAVAKAQRQKDLDVARAAQKREARSTSKGPGANGTIDKGKGRAKDDDSPSRAAASRSLSNGSSPEHRNGTKRSLHNGHRSGGSKASPSPISSVSSPGGSSPTSPSRATPVPSPTGFAGLRSSISSYLAPRSATAGLSNTPRSSSSPPPGNPLTRFVSYLRYHYSSDPIRLVSIVCFLLALSTYLRRRFAFGFVSKPRSRLGVASKKRLAGGLGVRSGMGMVMGKVGETLRMGTKVTTL